ncbi:MAG TPA: DUF503 domain-containing protein [Egibacteraceae bacterium]|nr:DUF503 domain-containing protein [Actinomycetota bacterium]HWB70971.1 DUF503 domain-containing protein [Egibacteraceae bacterium]
MFAALVSLDLHIPAVGSLKGKRAVIRALVSRLRQEVNCSVVEMDHQNLWQRAGIGVAVAAGSETGARKVVQQVEKIVARDPRVEIIAFHTELVVPEH